MKVILAEHPNIVDLSLELTVFRLLRQCEQVWFDWGDQPLGDSFPVALDSGNSTF